MNGRLAIAWGLFAVVFGCLPGAAWAQSKAVDGSSWTFSSRTDHDDGSSSLTFGTRLPAPGQAKLGLDLATAAPANTTIPEALSGAAADRESGAGWASLALPTAPLGLSKAELDARIDPNQDQRKVGVALTRPVNGSLAVTVENSYAMNGGALPFAAPSAAATSYEVGNTLRFDLLSTKTSFSAGETLSTLDEKRLRSVSAEQKIVGPLSIAGTVSETPTGALDRTIKAAFKATW